MCEIVAMLLSAGAYRQKILLGVSKRVEAKQQGAWGHTPQTLKGITHFCTTFVAVFTNSKLDDGHK